MGSARVSPIDAFNLHLTDANLAKTLSEGILVERISLSILRSLPCALFVRDDNSGSTGAP
jgi:hypothetical protein